MNRPICNVCNVKMNKLSNPWFVKKIDGMKTFGCPKCKDVVFIGDKYD